MGALAGTLLLVWLLKQHGGPCWSITSCVVTKTAWGALGGALLLVWLLKQHGGPWWNITSCVVTKTAWGPLVGHYFLCGYQNSIGWVLRGTVPPVWLLSCWVNLTLEHKQYIAGEVMIKYRLCTMLKVWQANTYMCILILNMPKYPLILHSASKTANVVLLMKMKKKGKLCFLVRWVNIKEHK